MNINLLPKPSERSIGIAARCWCEPSTSATVMDPILATEFALALDRELKSVPRAMEIVQIALREDPHYAWGWFCNITMMAQDAGCPKAEANEGAARFLQLLANVDVRKNEHWT